MINTKSAGHQMKQFLLQPVKALTLKSMKAGVKLVTFTVWCKDHKVKQ